MSLTGLAFCWGGGGLSLAVKDLRFGGVGLLAIGSFDNKLWILSSSGICEVVRAVGGLKSSLPFFWFPFDNKLWILSSSEICEVVRAGRRSEVFWFPLMSVLWCGVFKLRGRGKGGEWLLGAGVFVPLVLFLSLGLGGIWHAVSPCGLGWLGLVQAGQEGFYLHPRELLQVRPQNTDVCVTRTLQRTHRARQEEEGVSKSIKMGRLQYPMGGNVGQV